jgi:hypothetical protein
MACSDYAGAPWEIARAAWEQLNFWDGVVCPASSVVGLEGLALLLFVPAGLGLTIVYQSVAPIIVIILLFGGVTAANLPPSIVQGVVIVLTIGIALAVALAARRIRTPT